jgi:hypothetical protein
VRRSWLPISADGDQRIPLASSSQARIRRSTPTTAATHTRTHTRDHLAFTAMAPARRYGSKGTIVELLKVVAGFLLVMMVGSMLMRKALGAPVPQEGEVAAVATTNAVGSSTYSLHGEVRLPTGGRASSASAYAAGRVAVDGGASVLLLRGDGSFLVEGLLPSRTYTLDVLVREHRFEQLRVEVSKTGAMKVSALRVGSPLRVRVALPLVLRPVGTAEYFHRREPVNLFGLLKNPMVLMMGITVLMIVVMPRMMSSMGTRIEEGRERGVYGCHRAREREECMDVTEGDRLVREDRCAASVLTYASSHDGLPPASCASSSLPLADPEELAEMKKMQVRMRTDIREDEAGVPRERVDASFGGRCACPIRCRITICVCVSFAHTCSFSCAFVSPLSAPSSCAVEDVARRTPQDARVDGALRAGNTAGDERSQVEREDESPEIMSQHMPWIRTICIHMCDHE